MDHGQMSEDIHKRIVPMQKGFHSLISQPGVLAPGQTGQDGGLPLRHQQTEQKAADQRGIQSHETPVNIYSVRLTSALDQMTDNEAADNHEQAHGHIAVYGDEGGFSEHGRAAGLKKSSASQKKDEVA